MRLRKSTAAVLALLVESDLALAPDTIAKNTHVTPGIARKRCESLLGAEYVIAEDAWDRTFYTVTKLGRGRLIMQQRETSWVEGLGPDAQVRLFVDALSAIDNADDPPTIAEVADATDAEMVHVSAMIREFEKAGLVDSTETDGDATYTPRTKARRLVLSYE